MDVPEDLGNSTAINHCTFSVENIVSFQFRISANTLPSRQFSLGPVLRSSKKQSTFNCCTNLVITKRCSDIVTVQTKHVCLCLFNKRITALIAVIVINLMEI